MKRRILKLVVFLLLGAAGCSNDQPGPPIDLAEYLNTARFEPAAQVDQVRVTTVGIRSAGQESPFGPHWIAVDVALEGPKFDCVGVGGQFEGDLRVSPERSFELVDAAGRPVKFAHHQYPGGLVGPTCQYASVVGLYKVDLGNGMVRMLVPCCVETKHQLKDGEYRIRLTLDAKNLELDEASHSYIAQSASVDKSWHTFSLGRGTLPGEGYITDPASAAAP